ncbi:hypothetical protein [Kitasatospora acidiphila]|uniref:hypothetical protein n=1 Tax=Kitasatospora acidiphila TaxID=2567942 RepID=UPI0015EFDF03|nr:hypothetical protein [Kitasatospora acidiphila]
MIGTERGHKAFNTPVQQDQAAGRAVRTVTCKKGQPMDSATSRPGRGLRESPGEWHR